MARTASRSNSESHCPQPVDPCIARDHNRVRPHAAHIIPARTVAAQDYCTVIWCVPAVRVPVPVVVGCGVAVIVTAPLATPVTTPA